MFDKITKTFQYGQHTVILETGEMARQASGAVLVTIEDTVILATAVANKTLSPDQDFFPLTVDYVEKFYAAGRIPGGFLKREGKPSEKEILTSRLIDRPLRPLFPDGFYNEVQVIIHVLSCNPEIDPDIPAMIGASAALAISGIPFNGPMGACRVGYINSEYVLNPTVTQLKNSQMDLVVAGTETAVLMVESEAQQLSEDIMLSGIVYGHNAMQTAINAIHDLVRDAGKPLWNWTATPKNEELYTKIESMAVEPLKAAYETIDKQERTAMTRAVAVDITAQLLAIDPAIKTSQINQILFDLESKIVRGNILNGLPRIDGRDTRTVRPITMRTGVLPRTHGSALFTRGETQALVVTTLGTKQETQAVDSVLGESRDRFMFHYNMPPFATGEVGRFGSTKRREVGHGRLAKRALSPLLPGMEEFQYAIRVVSEITESNGSSSMASVCGGCLALMDAGVPIKAHVAGVAMGLIKEGNKFAVLTDILGDEDHLGDMDFKVAGTAQGITALQMDIKIQGITKEIMQVALAQAKEGRMHILSIMQANVSGVNTQISDFAPRVLTLKIHPEKIRDVIGKGGAVIRALCEETGCKIDITDEGLVSVSTTDSVRGEIAIEKIKTLTAVIEMGQVYEGTVTRLLDFGAIIEVLPGKDGMLHISQVSHERIESLSDVISVGQKVRVKVVEADDRGRIRFSMKALLDRPDTPVYSNQEVFN